MATIPSSNEPLGEKSPRAVLSIPETTPAAPLPAATLAFEKADALEKGTLADSPNTSSAIPPSSSKVVEPEPTEQPYAKYHRLPDGVRGVRVHRTVDRTIQPYTLHRLLNGRMVLVAAPHGGCS